MIKNLVIDAIEMTHSYISEEGNFSTEDVLVVGYTNDLLSLIVSSYNRAKNVETSTKNELQIIDEKLMLFWVSSENKYFTVQTSASIIDDLEELSVTGAGVLENDAWKDKCLSYTSPSTSEILYFVIKPLYKEVEADYAGFDNTKALKFDSIDNYLTIESKAGGNELDRILNKDEPWTIAIKIEQYVADANFQGLFSKGTVGSLNRSNNGNMAPYYVRTAGQYPAGQNGWYTRENGWYIMINKPGTGVFEYHPIMQGGKIGIRQYTFTHAASIGTTPVTGLLNFGKKIEGNNYTDYFQGWASAIAVYPFQANTILINKMLALHYVDKDITLDPTLQASKDTLIAENRTDITKLAEHIDATDVIDLNDRENDMTGVKGILKVVPHNFDSSLDIDDIIEI